MSHSHETLYTATPAYIKQQPHQSHQRHQLCRSIAGLLKPQGLPDPRPTAAVAGAFVCVFNPPSAIELRVDDPGFLLSRTAQNAPGCHQQTSGRLSAEGILEQSRGRFTCQRQGSLQTISPYDSWTDNLAPAAARASL